MYKTNMNGLMRQYDSINEDDAYFIAYQVLKEMQGEAIVEPQRFLNGYVGFSKLYRGLIRRLLATASSVEKASKGD